jgi:hypothetical protein
MKRVCVAGGALALTAGVFLLWRRSRSAAASTQACAGCGKATVRTHDAAAAPRAEKAQLQLHSVIIESDQLAYLEEISKVTVASAMLPSQCRCWLTPPLWCVVVCVRLCRCALQKYDSIKDASHAFRVLLRFACSDDASEVRRPLPPLCPLTLVSLSLFRD